MRFVVRLVMLAAAMLALPTLGFAAAGRGGMLAGAGLAAVGFAWIWLLLPRLAHAAFQAGAYAVSARRYRWLERLAGSATRERAARLSGAGCALAAGDVEHARSVLEAIDGEGLSAAERAVWLNNRACATLAAGGDPEDALALADEAGELRPDVPALQHTRGMALLAVGRIDDAIAVLDGMRASGELPPRLEAERCRELARAWDRKGEAAYADDYRARATAYAR